MCSAYNTKKRVKSLYKSIKNVDYDKIKLIMNAYPSYTAQNALNFIPSNISINFISNYNCGLKMLNLIEILLNDHIHKNYKTTSISKNIFYFLETLFLNIIYEEIFQSKRIDDKKIQKFNQAYNEYKNFITPKVTSEINPYLTCVSLSLNEIFEFINLEIDGIKVYIIYKIINEYHRLNTELENINKLIK